MSIVVSFTHILLLILHYYIVITSTRTKKASEFAGLIVTGWISSAAVGSSISVSRDHSVGHVLVLVGFVVVSALAMKSYHYVLQTHKTRESLQVGNGRHEMFSNRLLYNTGCFKTLPPHPGPKWLNPG